MTTSKRGQKHGVVEEFGEASRAVTTSLANAMLSSGARLIPLNASALFVFSSKK